MGSRTLPCASSMVCSINWNFSSNSHRTALKAGWMSGLALSMACVVLSNARKSVHCASAPTSPAASRIRFEFDVSASKDLALPDKGRRTLRFLVFISSSVGMLGLKASPVEPEAARCVRYISSSAGK